MIPLKTSALLCILAISNLQEPTKLPQKKQGQPAFFSLQTLPKDCPAGRAYCFFPSFPETGLVTSTKESGSTTLTLLQLRLLKGKYTWKNIPLGQLPPSTSTQNLLLGRVPFLGETPNFGLTWSHPGEAPHFIDHAPFLQTFPIDKAPPLGIPILSTDLDRDGLPELWAMNPDGENETAAPAFLFSSPLSDEPSNAPIPDLNIGGGFAGVLAYDFDHDFLEDFLLFGPGKKVALVLNKGSLSWGLAPDSALPQGVMGAPLRASKLFLSPTFEDKQWLLAQTDDNQILLLKKEGGKNFKALTRDLQKLGKNLRDARFLDQDLDGHPELWVLTAQGLHRVSLASSSITLIHEIQEGQRILVGDLDGDLAPDLCILREKKRPLLLRNRPNPGALDRSMAVSLEGIEEFPHAMGAYVELLLGERVLQRHRWPPQRTDDALSLYFSLPNPILETPSFRVTWPDGNVSETEVKPGTRSRLKH